MKKNITDKIVSLERIYREIPDDFVLQEARIFLRRAINEMKEIQSKRDRREKLQQTQQIQSSYANPEGAKIALKEIDRLIALENKKLEKPEKENPSDNDQFLIG